MTGSFTKAITLPNGQKYEQPFGLFIDNEFVPSKSGHTFETIAPHEEKIITEVYEAREDDVDIAVQSANKTFEESSWNTGDPAVRGVALQKLANIIEENAELLAHIESYDNGKSINDARGDIVQMVGVLRSTSGYADKLSGRVVETGDSHFSYTRKEPLGVCGQIIPWNFPLLMFTWKIAPSLVTGNTSVLKTSETTPLSVLYVCKLIKDNDIFPPGVLNVVNGFGKVTGNAIVEHPLVEKIAFTGSTATGKLLYKKCADSLKKISLELGGKSPHIVFDDANVDTAVQSVIQGIFYNSGEVCSAGSRLYVQEGIYDKFVDQFVKTTSSQVKVGNPFEEKTVQGAQNSKGQIDKIEDYVRVGKQEGARLLSGGTRLPGNGYFMNPTIFGDVQENMRIVKEEIFGPVITISKFKTQDEVIAKANDNDYGLAAGIQSNDINIITNVARKLKSGIIWVNTYNDFHPQVPFGGYNHSGLGRELGEEVLNNYVQVKSVRIALQ